MKILISIFLLEILISHPVMAREKLFKEDVGIGSFYLVMPVGRVLLIERDQFIGGVKFLRNERRADGTHSQYESFECEKKAFRMSRKGEVMLKNPSDIGKGGWFFHHGPNELFGPPLRIDHFSLCAHAAGEDHTAIYFWSKPDKVDWKVRMAPTPWKEINNVNLSDSRIRWFTYNDKDVWKVISIDKLWGE